LAGFERPEVVIDLSGEPSDVLESAPRRPGARAALAAGTVALLIVAVVQVANRTWPDAVAQAVPSQTQQRGQASPSPVRELDPAPLLDRLVEATFSDRDHGYVTMIRCPAHRHRECTAEIMFTGDGGRLWSRVRSPSEDRPFDGPLSQLYVFDKDTLVIDRGDFVPDPGVNATPANDSSPRPAGLPGYQPSRRWVSRNGGLSWHEVSPDPVGMVEEISDGERLIFPSRMFSTVAQVLRPDGSSARLANVPLGKLGPATAVTMEDGGVWLFGDAADDSGSYVSTSVYVSRDRGRSWRAVKLPEGVVSAMVLIAAGGTVCLIQYLDGGATIYTSRNSGATWRDLQLSPVFAPGFDTTVVPLRNAALLIAHGGKLYRNDLRTGSLAALPDSPTLSGLVPAGAWVLGMSPDQAVWGSPDGSAWMQLSGLT